MPTESALVVLIPEAEVLVNSFRNQYDPSAALGVPAHVTVLYPFKPPSELTTNTIHYLKKLFSEFPGFDAYFSRAGRFPDVLYLSPEPAETFLRLTELVTNRFPEAPPYSGRFTELIPHLTVAQIGDSQRLEEIAEDFARKAKGVLPISASVREIALLDNESGYWQVRQRFPLSPKPAGRVGARH